MTDIIKFQVGKTYTVVNRGYELGQVVVTKRTDKSVWLKHEDGTEARKGIKVLNDYEVVQSQNFSFNLFSNRVVTNETVETVETPQDVIEPTEPVETVETVESETITNEPVETVETFKQFDYLNQIYISKINPCKDQNEWINLKDMTFKIILAWEKGHLDIAVQWFLTGLSQSELDTLLGMLNESVEWKSVKLVEVNNILLGFIDFGSTSYDEEFNTTFVDVSVTPHQTIQDSPQTPSAPNNLIKVDFAARRKV
jgi:hypothetical protein